MRMNGTSKLARVITGLAEGDRGREMPGVDELTIDRGLTPHRFEPNAIHEGWQQGMSVKGLIQPGDGP
jgi:hypothetical protein